MTKQEELLEYLDADLLHTLLFEYLGETLEWHPDIEYIGINKDDMIEALGELERRTKITIT